MATDWNTIATVVQAVAPVFTAGAACVGAFVGVRGINRWREESIGKKRLELAEEALADFYEASDVFRWVRSPIAYGSESADRPGRNDDPERLKQHRDTYYVPLKRLSDHADFFARLRASRYKVMAVFGPDAGEPYEEVHRINVQIATSAQALMRIDPENERDRNFAREERLEADIWRGYGDPDLINRDIDNLIQSVERKFRPSAFGRYLS